MKRIRKGKRETKEKKKRRKEWRKEDEIIHVRKCKVWSNRYKEAKKDLGERRVQRKNKKDRNNNKGNKTKHKKGKYEESMAKTK